MSRTNIDYLFQLASPVRNRTPIGLVRGDEVELLFDNHLSQAASVSAASKSTRPESRARDESSGYPPQSSAVTSDELTSHSSQPSDESSVETGIAGDADDYADEDNQASETPSQPNTTTESGAPDAGLKSSGTEDAEVDENDERKSDDGNLEAPLDAALSVTTGVQKPSAEVADVCDAVILATEADGAEAFAMTPDEPAGDERSSKPTNGGLHVSNSITTDFDAAVGFEYAAEDAHLVAAEPDSAEPAATKSSRESKSAKRRAAAVTDAEAAPQAALTATDESQPQEEAKSELPIAKESDEPRRGRNLRSDNPDFVAASRSESVQVSGKAAEVPVVTGAVAIPHDAKTASAEAAHEAATAKKAVAAKIETLSAAANRLDAAATRRSGRADASDGAPHVDSARFVGRVAKAFQSAQDRGGTLQLRLSPPELGSLRLELTVKDGVMTAALETETASARRVLLDHLPALRDRLAEQNIRVERFDVEVRRDNSEGQSDPRAPHDRQQPQHGDPQPRRRPTAVPRASDAVPQNVSIHPARTINTRINIVA